MRLLTSFAPLFAPRFRVRGTKTLCRMSTQAAAKSEERFDLLNEDGSLKGVSKARSLVHRDGDLHRAVHIWVLARGNPPKLLLQKRSEEKDTFPVRIHSTHGCDVLRCLTQMFLGALGCICWWSYNCRR